jgi:ribosomal protein L13E
LGRVRLDLAAYPLARPAGINPRQTSIDLLDVAHVVRVGRGFTLSQELADLQLRQPQAVLGRINGRFGDLGDLTYAQLAFGL